MADKIELIILAVFGLLVLLLAQSREVMRQLARTAEEWRHMINAFRGLRNDRSASRTENSASQPNAETAQEPEDAGE